MGSGQKKRLTQVSPRLRMELLSNKRRRWATARAKEQGGVCYWCARPFRPEITGMAMTADHLVPLSKNGADHFENIVASHARCNAAKGDLMPHEFASPGEFVWRPKTTTASPAQSRYGDDASRRNEPPNIQQEGVKG